MNIIELIGYTAIGYVLIGILISIYYGIFKPRTFHNWQDYAVASVMMTLNWLPVTISLWMNPEEIDYN